MKLVKIIFLSAGIALAIVIMTVLLIIVPITESQNHIIKESEVIKTAEKKLKVVENAITKNSRNSEFLQERLQEKDALIFLEEKLKGSHLSIDSIKPSQGVERDEVHVVLKGEYRAFLGFMARLSQQESAIKLEDLSIKKNHIEMVFKKQDKPFRFEKNIQYHAILKRLASALSSIELPVFSLEPRLLLNEVQSPFLPRILPLKDGGPFQSLTNVEWRLAGEVRKQSQLLGVFLEANNQSR